MAAKKKGASRMKAGTGKRVDEDTVAINLKGIEGRRQRRTRIAEGNYLAKVHEAKAETAKSSGNDMVTWIFEIQDHEKYEGQRFWYRTVLAPQSLWNFRAVLEALGVKVKDTTMNIPLGRLAGRTCGIEVVDGEWEGKTVSEINDIFPEALLEEEDDEEDEFEDEEDDEEEDDEEEDDYSEDDEEDDEDEEDEDDWDEVDLDDEDL